MSQKSSTDSISAFLGLIAFFVMFGMLGYLAAHVGYGIYAKIQHRIEAANGEKH